MIKTNRTFCMAKTLILTVVALCCSAGLATAQSAARGEFTLPSEVRWGQAVLPAGHYSFDLRSQHAPELIQVRGGGKNVLIMAQGKADYTPSAHSTLVLVQNRDSLVVRSLRLGPLGMTLDYAAHKGEPKAVAMAPGGVQQVPVSVSR
jgi:hypothetical protein